MAVALQATTELSAPSAGEDFFVSCWWSSVEVTSHASFARLVIFTHFEELDAHLEAVKPVWSFHFIVMHCLKKDWIEVNSVWVIEWNSRTLKIFCVNFFAYNPEGIQPEDNRPKMKMLEKTLLFTI